MKKSGRRNKAERIYEIDLEIFLIVAKEASKRRKYSIEM